MTDPLDDAYRMADELRTANGQLDVLRRELDGASKERDHIAKMWEQARQGKLIYGKIIEVMRSVTHVAKTGRNEDQNYVFRGIDGTVNALGPAMRSAGVFVVPELVESSHRDALTTRGNKTREATVKVRYTFYAEDGSHVSVLVEGESLDSSDKGTAKAFSVALRIALLQMFMLPTQEPTTDDTGQYHTRAGGQGLSGWTGRLGVKVLKDGDADAVVDFWGAVIEADAIGQAMPGTQETWGEGTARRLAAIIDACWSTTYLKKLWELLKSAEIDLVHDGAALSARIRERVATINQTRTETFDKAMGVLVSTDTTDALSELWAVVNKRQGEGKLTMNQVGELAVVWKERYARVQEDELAASEPLSTEAQAVIDAAQIEEPSAAQPDEPPFEGGNAFLPTVGDAWNRFAKAIQADNLTPLAISTLLAGTETEPGAAEYGMHGLQYVIDTIRRSHRRDHSIDNAERAELEQAVTEAADNAGITLPGGWRK
jgi:hypothetical protein